MSIGLGLRFRILERDDFTCQYCGAKPPGISLEVDHINPVSNGGKNVAQNLITACYACNHGKRDSLLTPEHAAALSNRPLLPREAPVKRNPIEEVTRVVARSVGAIRKATQTKREVDERIPVAMSFVSTGEDSFNPKFFCAECGFLNIFEHESCGCRSRAHHESEGYWCSECVGVEVATPHSYCDECKDQLFCHECGEELGEPGTEFCPDCRTSIEEGDRIAELKGYVRCDRCGFEQLPGTDVCRVCDEPLGVKVS